MSTDTASAHNPDDAQAAAMLCALAGLLRSNAFLTECLDTLVAVERDTAAATDARNFADQSFDLFVRDSVRRPHKPCGIIDNAATPPIR